MKKRWRRFLLVCGVLAGLLAGLLATIRGWALPWLAERIALVAQQGGYPDITVDVTGAYTLQLTIRQRDEVLLDVPLVPHRLLASYVTGEVLTLPQARLRCPVAVADHMSVRQTLKDWVAEPVDLSRISLLNLALTEAELTCGPLWASVSATLQQGHLLAHGQIRLGKTPIQLEQLEIVPKPYALRLRVRELDHGVVLDLTQNFTGPTAALELTGSLTGELTLTDDQTVGFGLRINPKTRTGLTVPLEGQVTSADKTMNIKGQLDLAKDSLRLDVKGDLSLPALQVTGLSTTLDVTSLLSPTLKPTDLTIAALQLGGVPISAIKARYSYADREVKLLTAHGFLFGGRMFVAPGSVRMPLSAYATRLRLEDLELGQLVQLGQVQGLSADGRISGTIPLRYAAGKLTFDSSELLAVSQGNIRYQPAELPAFMAPGGQGALLAQIFDDFQYHGLTLRLGGTLGDNLTLGVRLAGKNVSFYNGHEVVLNLNLSGALESLLTKGLQSFQFSPEELGKLVTQGESP
mgnify:CR=1 FL=1